MTETLESCINCNHVFEDDEEFMEMSESMLGILPPEHFANMCMPCYHDHEE